MTHTPEIYRVELIESGFISSEEDWFGGRGLFVATGIAATDDNHNSGAIRFEFSIDGGTTWLNVPVIISAQQGSVLFELPPCKLRPTQQATGSIISTTYCTAIATNA